MARSLPRVILFLAAVLAAAVLYAAFELVRFIHTEVGWGEVAHVFLLGFYTLVRVMVLIVLAALVAWYGGDILDTFIPPLSGMMTFALALPVLFWLGGDLGRASEA